MKLQCLGLWDIRPYENNPRNNDNAVEAVAESIRQCTYVQPIIVDERHVILAGHTRYKALQLLGYDSCECLIVEGLTEEQKRKFRYLDNKTGEAAEWDVAKHDIVSCQSFPQDYDFLSNKPQYVCGMSVPPVMMANIAAEVYDQVFRGEEHGQNDTSAAG